MPRMEWGCKDALQNTFQNFAEIGVPLEHGLLRSSGHADKRNPLKRGLLRSSGLQATVKVLDVWNSRSMGARYPLEREIHVLARTCITPLERTVNTCKVLDTCISRSHATFPCSSGLHELNMYARAWSSLLERESKIWNFQIWTSSSKLNYNASNSILLG